MGAILEGGGLARNNLLGEKCSAVPNGHYRFKKFCKFLVEFYEGKIFWFNPAKVSGLFVAGEISIYAKRVRECNLEDTDQPAVYRNLLYL